MMGAVFSEMGEGWATGRWLTGEPIAQAASPVGSAAPASSCDGTAEGHAKRIIDAVVADNPIGRRGA